MSITMSSFSLAVNSKCLYPRYSLVTKCPKYRKISVKFEAKTSYILELRLSQNHGALLWLSQFQACPFPLGICHPVGPGGWEFVRKPLPECGAIVNSFRSASHRSFSLRYLHCPKKITFE